MKTVEMKKAESATKMDVRDNKDALDQARKKLKALLQNLESLQRSEEDLTNKMKELMAIVFVLETLIHQPPTEGDLS